MTTHVRTFLHILAILSLLLSLLSYGASREALESSRSDVYAMVAKYELRALEFLVPPVIWFSLVLFANFRRARGVRRSAQGRCLACGYDLRATPDRCPEYGKIATAFTNADPPMTDRVGEWEYVPSQEQRGCVVSMIIGLLGSAVAIWLLYKFASGITWKD